MEEEAVQDLMVIERGLYEHMRDLAVELLALREHGVENWVYYDAAMETKRSMMEPDPAQQELDLMAGAQITAAQEGDDV